MCDELTVNNATGVTVNLILLNLPFGSFFGDYKKLEKKEVRVDGFDGPEKAREIIQEGMKVRGSIHRCSSGWLDDRHEGGWMS